MEMEKTIKQELSFSLTKTAKPKFKESQIRIGDNTRIEMSGLPSQTYKLVVRKNGRIGYGK